MKKKEKKPSNRYNHTPISIQMKKKKLNWTKCVWYRPNRLHNKIYICKKSKNITHTHTYSYYLIRYNKTHITNGNGANQLNEVHIQRLVLMMIESCSIRLFIFLLSVEMKKIGKMVLSHRSQYFVRRAYKHWSQAHARFCPPFVHVCICVCAFPLFL